MAVYKVPQDVEAEDKLLGPFSFRQFVYLIIAGVGGLVAWLMWNLSPPIAVIPIPIIIFFVILALPLRKDQPMEIYLIAVVHFFLKPKKRLWSPDGTMSLVQITAPKTLEARRSKDISENEAMNRLSYLADIMDSRGWAARGVSGDSAVNSSIAAEAAQTEDVMDKTATVAKSFDSLIEQKDASRRQDAIATMRQQAQEPASRPTPAAPARAPAPAEPSKNPYAQFMSLPPAASSKEPDTVPPDTTAPAQSTSPSVHFNPYPDSMHQQVVQPVGTHYQHETPQEAPNPPAPQSAPESPSVKEVSPDIINLANNTDFTISTIAHEAQRIHQRESGDSEEVVISLR